MEGKIELFTLNRCHHGRGRTEARADWRRERLPLSTALHDNQVIQAVSKDHIQEWHSHVTSRVAFSTENTLPAEHRSILPLSLVVTGPKV